MGLLSQYRDKFLIIEIILYFILTYLPSLQSFNQAVLLYVNLYINKEK